MKKNNIDQIRNSFISFFKKNHHYVNSSSLLPKEDPSLLFVNSGMVQFKSFFTGIEKPKYTNVTSCQKCVRAGGKHNDLENVGYTSRHHTFFEMLGNFSFGGYFKEQAIYYCWQLLTKVYNIPQERLHVTVYYTDSEAFSLWKKISQLSDNKIIKIKTNDNFWSLGNTGPCGPSSEVFFDLKGEKNHFLTKKDEDERYIEIWNMVFMQFEKLPNGKQKDLPIMSVDTGMGLERITSVLEGKVDNYEISLFKELIDYTYSITEQKQNKDNIFSVRIISDHIRAICFLIADQIFPSNEGRGYVLRKIIRRTILHRNKLTSSKSILQKIAAKLIDLMGHIYPELETHRDLIFLYINNEEEKFSHTLNQGLKILEKEIKNSVSEFSSEKAFKLYDTYGFPINATQDILKRHNIKIDINKFNIYMDKQKMLSKIDRNANTQISKLDEFLNNLKDKLTETKFTGHNLHEDEGKILFVYNNKELPFIEKNKIYIITDKTPFYAESGGQVSDIGFFTSAQCKIQVLDVQKKLNGVFLHECILLSGKVDVGQLIKMQIDIERRKKISANHSATHILHFCLRNILGNHINQKGSIIYDHKLRFDFNHHKPLSEIEINQIEYQTNKIIAANTEVIQTTMPLQKAVAEGALAYFDEKYDENVKVITISNSKELCCGTHVNRTGDIGIFKIISQTTIASGIKRIEALTGTKALYDYQQNQDIINSISNLLNTTKLNINDKINNIINKNKKLILENNKLKKNSISITKEEIKKIGVETKKSTILFKLITQFNEEDINLVRETAISTCQKHQNLIAIFCSLFEKDKKIIISISLSKTVEKLTAANKISEYINNIFKLKGGGGTRFAQTGGKIVNFDYEKFKIHCIKFLSCD